MADGDQWGMSVISGVVKVYQNGTQVGSVSDSTHTSGYIGLDFTGGSPPTYLVTNFGGGAPVTSTANGGFLAFMMRHDRGLSWIPERRPLWKPRLSLPGWTGSARPVL
jgi:hypothetical protein